MKCTFSVASRNTLLALAALAAGLSFAGPVSAADPGKLTIQADKPKFKMSPHLYGLMTEELNYSYQGGLYGELIQNRTFMDSASRATNRAGAPEATAATLGTGPCREPVAR